MHGEQGALLATALFLSLKLSRPLFLEGEAGVGKTEIAKVLATTLGRRLIRLQCYEGLDVSAAVYEWNYGAQMIAIRLAEAEGEGDRQDPLHHGRKSSRLPCCVGASFTNALPAQAFTPKKSINTPWSGVVF